MAQNPGPEFERIERRLTELQRRLQQIADIEARAAWTGGEGARGEFEQERGEIIAQTDALIDRVERLLDA